MVATVSVTSSRDYVTFDELDVILSALRSEMHDLYGQSRSLARNDIGSDPALNVTLDEEYVTQSEMDDAIAAAVRSIYSSVYNKTQVRGLIADFLTSTEISAAITAALGSYLTATEINTLIADFLTSTEINSLLASMFANY